MRAFLRNNGLSIVLLALFLLAIVGQVVAGRAAYEEELRLHDLPPPVGLTDYLATGHFLSATFENWESEFLQMAVYVLLTALLIQKGSPESKKPEGDNPEDQPPEQTRGDCAAPWPVRQGGLILRLYAHSLSIALVALFALSFWLHLSGSTRRANAEAALHGDALTTMNEMIVDPQFWYESFQNWQSEFLSIAVLVLLGIALREKGSPESKPVGAPHGKTGH